MKDFFIILFGHIVFAIVSLIILWIVESIIDLFTHGGNNGRKSNE